MPAVILNAQGQPVNLDGSPLSGGGQGGLVTPGAVGAGNQTTNSGLRTPGVTQQNPVGSSGGQYNSASGIGSGYQQSLQAGQPDAAGIVKGDGSDAGGPPIGTLGGMIGNIGGMIGDTASSVYNSPWSGGPSSTAGAPTGNPVGSGMAGVAGSVGGAISNAADYLSGGSGMQSAPGGDPMLGHDRAALVGAMLPGAPSQGGNAAPPPGMNGSGIASGAQGQASVGDPSQPPQQTPQPPLPGSSGPVSRGSTQAGPGTGSYYGGPSSPQSDPSSGSTGAAGSGVSPGSRATTGAVGGGLGTGMPGGGGTIYDPSGMGSGPSAASFGPLTNPGLDMNSGYGQGVTSNALNGAALGGSAAGIGGRGGLGGYGSSLGGLGSGGLGGGSNAQRGLPAGYGSASGGFSGPAAPQFGSNFNAGGGSLAQADNPISGGSGSAAGAAGSSGAAGGSGAGLSQSLGQSYQDQLNAANQANATQIQNVVGGYGSLQNSQLNTLGQTTQQQYANINNAAQQQQAGATQDLTDRGLGGTSVPANVSRGINQDAQTNLNNLTDQRLQEVLGIQGTDGGNALSSLNSFNQTGPDMTALAAMTQGIGMSGQNPAVGNYGSGGAAGSGGNTANPAGSPGASSPPGSAPGQYGNGGNLSLQGGTAQANALQQMQQSGSAPSPNAAVTAVGGSPSGGQSSGVGVIQPDLSGTYSALNAQLGNPNLSSVTNQSGSGATGPASGYMGYLTGLANQHGSVPGITSTLMAPQSPQDSVAKAQAAGAKQGVPVYNPTGQQISSGGQQFNSRDGGTAGNPAGSPSSVGSGYQQSLSGQSSPVAQQSSSSGQQGILDGSASAQDYQNAWQAQQSGQAAPLTQDQKNAGIAAWKSSAAGQVPGATIPDVLANWNDMPTSYAQAAGYA